MNEGRRLLSIFIAPGALFEDLRERPRWVVPFLITIFVAGLALVLPRLLIPADVWLDALRESLPEGASMSVEQMTLMSQQMRSPLALGGIALYGIIVNVLLTFLSALVFWALFALFGIRPQSDLYVSHFDELVDPAYIRGVQPLQCAVIGNAYEESAAVAIRKSHHVCSQRVGVGNIDLELPTRVLAECNHLKQFIPLHDAAPARGMGTST